MEPTEHPGHGWVDVRDVAAAHIRALESQDAGGQRIIVSGGEWVWQDMSKLMHPMLIISKTNANKAVNAALSLPGSIYKPHADVSGPKGVTTRLIKFDTRKEKRLLGIQFRTLQEHVYDILVDYIKRGWY